MSQNTANPGSLFIYPPPEHLFPLSLIWQGEEGDGDPVLCLLDLGLGTLTPCVWTFTPLMCKMMEMSYRNVTWFWWRLNKLIGINFAAHCLALCGSMAAFSGLCVPERLRAGRQGGATLWQVFLFLHSCCSKMVKFLHTEMGNKNVKQAKFGNPAHCISNLCILIPFWELFFFVVGIFFWEMVCGMWARGPWNREELWTGSDHILRHRLVAAVTGEVETICVFS